jgi:uncharacterized membrane protein YbhN (UPF0104 family)
MIVAWWELLLAKGVAVPLTRVAYVFLASNYLSVVLPSSVAGDAIRVYGMANQMRRPEDALSSMMVLRYLGLLCMLSFAVTVAWLPGLRSDLIAGVAVLGLFAGVVGIPVLMAWSGVRRMFSRILRPWPSVHGWIQQLHRSIMEYRRVPGTLFRVSAYSVGFHLLRIATFYLVGVSLAIQVDFLAYFIYVPLIFVATMLPVSVAGLGVAEGGFALMFHRLNLPAVQGLSLSLVAFSLTLGVVLIGGICYLVGGPLRMSAGSRASGTGSLLSKGEDKG